MKKQQFLCREINNKLQGLVWTHFIAICFPSTFHGQKQTHTLTHGLLPGVYTSSPSLLRWHSHQTLQQTGRFHSHTGCHLFRWSSCDIHMQSHHAALNRPPHAMRQLAGDDALTSATFQQEVMLRCWWGQEWTAWPLLAGSARLMQPNITAKQNQIIENF